MYIGLILVQGGYIRACAYVGAGDLYRIDRCIAVLELIAALGAYIAVYRCVAVLWALIVATSLCRCTSVYTSIYRCIAVRSF